jgi:hypothetical protein
MKMTWAEVRKRSSNVRHGKTYVILDVDEDHLV